MHIIYVMLLVRLWLASMAELVLGLHGFLYRGPGAGLSGADARSAHEKAP